jgi:hypothetical protein
VHPGLNDLRHLCVISRQTATVWEICLVVETRRLVLTAAMIWSAETVRRFE